MFVLRGFEMHGRRFLSFLHCAFVRSWLKGLYLTLHDLTQRSICENMNQKLYMNFPKLNVVISEVIYGALMSKLNKSKLESIY